MVRQAGGVSAQAARRSGWRAAGRAGRRPAAGLHELGLVGDALLGPLLLLGSLLLRALGFQLVCGGLLAGRLLRSKLRSNKCFGGMLLLLLLLCRCGFSGSGFCGDRGSGLRGSALRGSGLHSQWPGWHWMGGGMAGARSSTGVPLTAAQMSHPPGLACSPWLFCWGGCGPDWERCASRVTGSPSIMLLLARAPPSTTQRPVQE